MTKGMSRCPVGTFNAIKVIVACKEGATRYRGKIYMISCPLPLSVALVGGTMNEESRPDAAPDGRMSAELDFLTAMVKI
jgi:hypothetical protein